MWAGVYPFSFILPALVPKGVNMPSGRIAGRRSAKRWHGYGVDKMIKPRTKAEQEERPQVQPVTKTEEQKIHEKMLYERYGIEPKE